MVNPAHLIVMVKGTGLRDHPAHGNGQPGGGDHQQYVIDVVGCVEVAEALLADDGVEGNFVQSADDLDNGRCHCEQRGALKKILLFLHIRHGFILSAGKCGGHFVSSNSRGMAYSVSSSTTFFMSMVGKQPFS